MNLHLINSKNTLLYKIIILSLLITLGITYIRVKIEKPNQINNIVIGKITNMKTGKEEDTDLPSSNVLYYELNDDAWVCVRPSGTEDYVRITLESRSEERAEEIRDACVKIINENL